MKVYLPGDVTAFIRPARGEMLEAGDERALRQFMRGQPVEAGENVAAGPDGLTLCGERMLWFVPNDGLWGRLAAPGNELHRIVMCDVCSALASLDLGLLPTQVVGKTMSIRHLASLPLGICQKIRTTVHRIGRLVCMSDAEMALTIHNVVRYP